METKQTHLKPKTPIRCIVKLGGAAITCKNDFEKINEGNLVTVSLQLQQAMMSGSSSGPVLEMDWSKRPGISETLDRVDNFKEQHVLDFSSFVVIHGAGSFGHFQASKSGVHRGGLNQPLVKAGFVATRISRVFRQLQCLHFHVDGQPMKEMLGCAWKLSHIASCLNFMHLLQGYNKTLKVFRFLQIASADVSTVVEALNSGFIPVLHGDAVLDESLGCTILSGDVIISHLAAQLKPQFVVFLTDVFGVYDRPPAEPDAVLLREIAVREDGSWSVVKPTFEDANRQVEISVASHDTTGGMMTKISEAAMIAKLGIDVYIVKAATEHSLIALSGKLRDKIPEDWLGTVIRYVS